MSLEIMPHVCADFYDKHRNLICKITRSDLHDYMTVPDSIQEDPLFQMLVNDGSIKYSPSGDRDKKLEQDPLAGMTAEGKEIKPKAKPAAKPKADPKPETKSELKPEEKPAENPTEKPVK